MGVSRVVKARDVYVAREGENWCMRVCVRTRVLCACACGACGACVRDDVGALLPACTHWSNFEDEASSKYSGKVTVSLHVFQVQQTNLRMSILREFQNSH